MSDNKLYVRRGREDRGPAPSSEFVEAWVDFLDLNPWRAQEQFEEAVAHGEIYEVYVDDRGQGQDVQEPVGCICPPTSERTCMNLKCPRLPTREYRSPPNIVWAHPCHVSGAGHV